MRRNSILENLYFCCKRVWSMEPNFTHVSIHTITWYKKWLAALFACRGKTSIPALRRAGSRDSVRSSGKLSGGLVVAGSTMSACQTRLRTREFQPIWLGGMFWMHLCLLRSNPKSLLFSKLPSLGAWFLLWCSSLMQMHKCCKEAESLQSSAAASSKPAFPQRNRPLVLVLGYRTNVPLVKLAGWNPRGECKCIHLQQVPDSSYHHCHHCSRRLDSRQTSLRAYWLFLRPRRRNRRRAECFGQTTFFSARKYGTNSLETLRRMLFRWLGDHAVILFRYKPLWESLINNQYNGMSLVGFGHSAGVFSFPFPRFHRGGSWWTSVPSPPMCCTRLLGWFQETRSLEK